MTCEPREASDQDVALIVGGVGPASVRVAPRCAHETACGSGSQPGILNSLESRNRQAIGAKLPYTEFLPMLNRAHIHDLATGRDAHSCRQAR
jgi:hypothetical protein